MGGLETKKLGLAAYIKMHGVRLLAYRSGIFRFDYEGEKSITDWELDYMNSCCQRHDTELMSLKKLVRG